MKYDIPVHIIYYVELIGICHENLLLLLPSDVRAQQEEASATFAGELTAALRGAGGVTAVPVVGQEVAGAAATQPCLQGQERQLTHCRFTRRKYTIRLTKMPSNNTKALQRDEVVSIKAKNRLLIRSHGLL